MSRHQVHYSLGFVLIPQLLFNENQQDLIQTLPSQRGAEYLKKLWDQLAGDENIRIHSSEFYVEKRSLPNNYLAIVIKFPKAQESHEAEFAGILCDADPSLSEVGSVRYLTFECSIMPGFPATTMKAEWRVGGARRSLGFAVNSTMEGMFDELGKLIPLDKRAGPTAEVNRPKAGPTLSQQVTGHPPQILEVRDEHFEFRYQDGSLSFRAVGPKSWAEFLPRACVVKLSERVRTYQKSNGGQRIKKIGENSSHNIGMSEVSKNEFEDCAPLVVGSASDMANMILRQGHNARFPNRFRYPFTFRKRAVSTMLQTSSPIFFEMDVPTSREYSALQEATIGLTQSPIKKIEIEKWIVGEDERYKGNGGMESQLISDDIYVYQIKPDQSQMNITPPVFIVGTTQIFFLPHCMMFHLGSSAKFIFYESVTCSLSDQTISFPDAPHGVSVVDWTWTFMNKDGGPDRRYSDNPSIPIVAVTELRFDFDESESKKYIFSDGDAARRFRDALTKLSLFARQAN